MDFYYLWQFVEKPERSKQFEDLKQKLAAEFKMTTVPTIFR